MRTLITFLFCTAAVACRSAAMAPGNAQWIMSLENALPNNRQLDVLLDVRNDAVKGAIATARRFNSRPHHIDASGLSLRDGRLRGSVSVTVNPDPWVPRDGKVIACEYTIDAGVEGTDIAGKHSGRHGVSGGKDDSGTAVEGAIEGSLKAAPAASDYTRLRMRFFSPLITMWDYKSSPWPRGTSKYAMDMNLIASSKDGKVFDAVFENTNPDYRGYAAIVRKVDARLDGSALTGTVRVDLDNGGQGVKGAERYAAYALTLNGQVIGDTVAGTYDCKAGDDEVKGFLFLGKADHRPPPAPNNAYAFLRLHRAMRNDFTVFMHLSLSDSLVHGMGYAPRWTHQTQKVDASGLKVSGNTLKGRLVMPIYMCVYKKTAPTFDLEYELDVKLDGYNVTGTFTGVDDGEAYSGPVTGELSHKPVQSPMVTMRNLALCEFAPHKRMHMRLVYKVGTLVKAAVVDPTVAAKPEAGKESGDPLAENRVLGVLENVDLRIDGDRIVASMDFTLASGSAEPGKYHYDFEATIRGERMDGLWRAKHNGKDIYVKSAKLDGRVSAAKREEGAE